MQAPLGRAKNLLGDEVAWQNASKNIKNSLIEMENTSNIMVEPNGQGAKSPKYWGFAMQKKL